MYAPSWTDPTTTIVLPVVGAKPDEVEEEADEPEVPVGWEVTVPVPAVPAWLIKLEQVPVALVVEVTVAEPPKLQADAAEFCSV